MIRLLQRLRRRDDIDPLLELPPGALGGYTLPDGTHVDDVEAFVTRLVTERTAYRRPTDSSGGETTAVPSPAAVAAGEPPPPDDTTAQAQVAEQVLDELAQALAEVTIPGALLADSPGRYRLHREYAEAVALAGWRPPTDKIKELA